MRHGFGYFEEDALTKLGDITLWKRILSYTAGYWRWIVLAIVLSLIISGTTLTLPYIIRIAIDDAIVNLELAKGARIDRLAELAVPFLILVIIGFAANFFQVALLEWTGQHIMHRMRQHLFSHILHLDLPFFNAHPIGKLVTRLTNDIQNMHEMFTSVIVTLFNDLFRIVGILAILYWMNWRLALIMSLLIPMMIVYTIWFSRLARGAAREIRTQLARINSFLQESLSGVSIIQLFSRQTDTREKFFSINQSYFKKTMYQIKIFGIFMPFIDVLSAFSIGMILWYGGSQILSQYMTLGVLVAFLSYMRLFFQPLRELSQKYSIIQSAMASSERIFQLLDTSPTIKIDTETLIPEKVYGAIEFRAVRFSYEKDLALISGFDLSIKAGETLAIVGATGAGKTTIINLLERFYDPESGEIFLDGKDIRYLDLQWLRQQIGLVMQDVFVIPSSIRENILLDCDRTEERLQHIIADAQLLEFIQRLPKGLETKIGEGGMEISAGQRQLLAFARILARDPRILILDEATSSVDTETEILIEQAIAASLANRTNIIIAHRLSTIRRADRILVLDNGRIIEQGTHEVLMEKKGRYYHLNQLQNNAGLIPAISTG